MKSERRHELQHNELADWLIKFGQSLKPYQNVIWAAVVALMVVLAAYSWWSRTTATQTAQAWSDLSIGLQAGNLDILTRVSETHPNTTVAQVASLVSADWHLAQGCDQRFINRAIAQQELSRADKSYSMVLEQCRTPSLLERATYGMARVKESQGELEPATKFYKEVVAKWPEGAYAAAASQRLGDLKRHGTKLMFDDLRDFDPKPSFSNEVGVPETPSSVGESAPEEKLIEMPKAKPEKKVDAKKPEKRESKKK